MALHTSPRQHEKGEYFPPPPLTFHKSWEEGRTRGGPPPPPPPLHSKYGEEGKKGIQGVLFSPDEEKDSLEMVEGEVKHVELEFSTWPFLAFPPSPASTVLFEEHSPRLRGRTYVSSRGRRKREEAPSQREEEAEFEQDRATQNYPVTLLRRNTTKGGGEPFAESAEEGGRGDSRWRWRRRAQNFFIRPSWRACPLTTRFFTKKLFFFSFSRRSL